MRIMRDMFVCFFHYNFFFFAHFSCFENLLRKNLIYPIYFLYYAILFEIYFKFNYFPHVRITGSSTHAHMDIFSRIHRIETILRTIFNSLGGGLSQFSHFICINKVEIAYFGQLSYCECWFLCVTINWFYLTFFIFSSVCVKFSYQIQDIKDIFHLHFILFCRV